MSARPRFKVFLFSKFGDWAFDCDPCGERWYYDQQAAAMDGAACHALWHEARARRLAS